MIFDASIYAGAGIHLSAGAYGLVRYWLAMGVITKLCTCTKYGGLSEYS